MTESQNELIRSHINKLWDSEIDLTKPENRRSSVDTFLKANPTLKQSSATAAHQKQLESIAKERGKSINDYKNAGKAKKPAYNESMNTQITATAQDVPATSVEKGTVGGGAMPQAVQNIQTYSSETVAAVFDGIYSGIRLAVPDADDLTDEQKKSLGDLWREPFNKYLGGNEKFDIVIAAAATIGILSRNLIVGYRRGQDKKLEKAKITPSQNTMQTQQKKLEEKKKDNPHLELPTGDGLTDE